jgi:hypothetical protein
MGLAGARACEGGWLRRATCEPVERSRTNERDEHILAGAPSLRGADGCTRAGCRRALATSSAMGGFHHLAGGSRLIEALRLGLLPGSEDSCVVARQDLGETPRGGMPIVEQRRGDI